MNAAICVDATRGGAAPAGAHPRRRGRLVRRAAYGLLGLCALGGVFGFVVPASIGGPSEARLEVSRIAELVVAEGGGTAPLAIVAEPPALSGALAAIAPMPAVAQPPPLKVMSLNLAHGRADGIHQLLLDQDDFEANLGLAAEVVARERAHVVALQEADGPSVWSGDFNHIGFLARAARYPYFVRGEHVGGLGLSYGTASLSRLDLEDARSYAFEPTPPTFPKGFCVAMVPWPGAPEVEVDVVTAHLDFARAGAREGQIEELCARLADRGRPLIVMGDLNAEWTSGEATVPALCRKLGLQAYRADADDLKTFPTLDRRLDWILISKELRFERYEVIDDVISDHKPILAEIALR